MGMNVQLQGKDSNNKPIDIGVKGTAVETATLDQFLGVKHNRVFAIANTTYTAAANRRTWTTAEGVRSVEVTFTNNTGEVSQNRDEYLLVTWDAPSSGTAELWFADADVTTEVQYDKVYLGETRLFSFTAALTAMDVLPVGLTGTGHVLAEATSNA